MRASPSLPASVSSSVAGRASKHYALTISSLHAHVCWYLQTTYPSLGVPPREVEPGVNRPKLPASRSFCSSASARRLRKSERWTRPTVWDFSRSSAVEAEVKRELFADGLGVETREGGLVDGFEEAMDIAYDIQESRDRRSNRLESAITRPKVY